MIKGYRSIAMLLVLCMLAIGLPVVSGAGGTEAEPINSYTELIEAIADASGGEVLYVTDLDFDTATFRDDLDRITVDKSVTLRGVGSEGREQAVFSNGSLDLRGSAVSGSRLNCRFENIRFDGMVAGAGLTAADWTVAEGASDPEQAQYAVSVEGNAAVTFAGCSFVNYMYPYGPALHCSYDGSETCSLELTYENCEFRDNYALYAGGALYLRGLDKNVKLTAKDCIFAGNVSGVGDATMYFGGGALHLYAVEARLENCVFTENTGNHNYADALPLEPDQTKGGAIYAMGCDVTMEECLLERNVASTGGAISAYISRFTLDGCTLRENRAQYHSEAPAFRWPQCSAQMGLAGAIYVNGSTGDAMRLYNCAVTGNRAAVAYGGIYGEYNSDMTEDWGFPRVELNLCAYTDNVSETSEYGHEMLWYFTPGNIWDIPYFSAFGSVILDETFAETFPTEQRPDGENGYNYMASRSAAQADGVLGEGHFSAAQYVIPTEAVAARLGGHADAYLGDFLVGSNYRPFVSLGGDAAGELGYGEALSVPGDAMPGHTLTGWSYGEGASFLGSSPMVGAAADMPELYAAWSPNTYRATFHHPEGPVTLDQTYGEPTVLPDAPRQQGQRFAGWFTEGGEKVEADYTYLTDMEFFARFRQDVTLLWVLGVLAVLGLGGAAVAHRRKQTPEPVAQIPEERIVKTRYGEEEIDAIVAAIPQTHILTARELEVLRELLKGRKQGEIAYYLGISVSTVKDNAGRIYGKLGIANKKELFELVDQKLNK